MKCCFISHEAIPLPLTAGNKVSVNLAWPLTVTTVSPPISNKLVCIDAVFNKFNFSVRAFETFRNNLSTMHCEAVNETLSLHLFVLAHYSIAIPGSDDMTITTRHIT